MCLIIYENHFLVLIVDQLICQKKKYILINIIIKQLHSSLRTESKLLFSQSPKLYLIVEQFYHFVHNL